MPKFDVLTIGNAIVDILARCEDGFLNENGITKGAMNLIDAERAELLYSKMGHHRIVANDLFFTRFPFVFINCLMFGETLHLVVIFAV